MDVFDLSRTAVADYAAFARSFSTIPGGSVQDLVYSGALESERPSRSSFQTTSTSTPAADLQGKPSTRAGRRTRPMPGPDADGPRRRRPRSAHVPRHRLALVGPKARACSRRRPLSSGEVHARKPERLPKGAGHEVISGAGDRGYAALSGHPHTRLSSQLRRTPLIEAPRGWT